MLVLAVMLSLYGIFYWLTTAVEAETACSSCQLSNVDLDSTSIAVLTNGYHTQLLLPCVPDNNLVERPISSECKGIAYSWGDSAYFCAADPPLSRGAKAMFSSKASVVQVNEWRGNWAQFHWRPVDIMPLDAGDSIKKQPMPTYEGCRLRISQEQLKALRVYIRKSIQMDSSGRAKPVQLVAGMTTSTYFYQAHGDYYLFNTCNTWTADGLAAIGIQRPKIVIGSAKLTRRLCGEAR
jgi:hypothetical protein